MHAYTLIGTREVDGLPGSSVAEAGPAVIYVMSGISLRIWRQRLDMTEILLTVTLNLIRTTTTIDIVVINKRTKSRTAKNKVKQKLYKVCSTKYSRCVLSIIS